MKYPHILRQLASLSLQDMLTSRVDSLAYLLGKILRFGLFWLTITGIYHFLPQIAGYSYTELLTFFLTFNLVDVMGQALFRGVYFLGDAVKYGRFDYMLVKPIRPLFFVLFRFIDWLDCVFLIPITILMISVLSTLGPQVTAANLIWYVCGLIIALIISLTIHIAAAGITVRAGESEQVVWLYREIFQLGRFPTEIFPLRLQLVLTYVIPIAISIAWPTKILLGYLSPSYLWLGAGISLLALAASLRFWRSSLYYYSSASS